MSESCLLDTGTLNTHLVVDKNRGITQATPQQFSSKCRNCQHQHSSTERVGIRKRFSERLYEEWDWRSLLSLHHLGNSLPMPVSRLEVAVSSLDRKD